MGRRAQGPLVIAAAASLAFASACSDASSPSDPTPVDGATPVRGTEHLAWSQAGDVSKLRFRLYVDDRPVELGSATCDAAQPAECRSPLPPLTSGVHSIALVNVLIASGIESGRTSALSIQKVAANASLTAVLPRAAARSGGVRLETVLSIGDVAYSADIVATGIDRSAQLAALPDGRLLVGNGDGQVLVVRPEQVERPDVAFDARETLSPPPVASIAVARHPQFTANHFVYLSFLAKEDQERAILRVVRTREAGDALGEAATLFETPVTARQAPGGPAGDLLELLTAPPRMAFGPDGLLYVLLPPGVEFEREPAASVPVASMVRLTDEGRLPAAGPLRGLTAAPLGFTWQPDTGAMLAIFPGAGDDTVIRSLASTSSEPAAAGLPLPAMRHVRSAAGETLLMQPDVRAYASLKGVASRAAMSRWTARLTAPVLVAPSFDRVGDVVAGSDGALFLTLEGSTLSVSAGADAGGVVVRLTPIPAPAAP
jgi:glucose/arabinose dehydrogenase